MPPQLTSPESLLGQTETTQPWCLRFRPGTPRLMLSVDENLPDMLINGDYDLPVLFHNGERVTDGRVMWKGRMLTCEQHVEQLSRRRADRNVVGYVGNGDLLANLGSGSCRPHVTG